MTPDRRRADRWALPSTLMGCILILAAIALLAFTPTDDTVCLGIGVLGGVLVRGEHVATLLRWRRP